MIDYANYQEYLRLPEFREVCGIVRERSGGVCEWCGVNKATEPHHVVYCKWGEIDHPFNLLDVCHDCHCYLHTCDLCGLVTLKASDIKSGARVCKECRGHRRNHG
jgi:hypothetical protein